MFRNKMNFILKRKFIAAFCYHNVHILFCTHQYIPGFFVSKFCQVKFCVDPFHTLFSESTASSARLHAFLNVLYSCSHAVYSGLEALHSYLAALQCFEAQHAFLVKPHSIPKECIGSQQQHIYFKKNCIHIQCSRYVCLHLLTLQAT